MNNKSLFIEDRKQIMTHINDESEDILKHYGVLGMKWGHRKAERKPSRRERKRAEKERAVDESYGKHLSDKELTERINRLSKEEQYHRLITSQNAAKAEVLKSKGRKRLDRIIDNVFWGSVENAGKQELTYMMRDPKKAIKKYS